MTARGENSQPDSEDDQNNPNRPTEFDNDAGHADDTADDRQKCVKRQLLATYSSGHFLSRGHILWVRNTPRNRKETIVIRRRCADAAMDFRAALTVNAA
jgi:hypothetical protein